MSFDITIFSGIDAEYCNPQNFKDSHNNSACIRSPSGLLEDSRILNL